MRRLAFVVLTVLLLTGCNGGGSDDKSKDGDKDSTSSTSTTPAPADTCPDFWKAGATLPTDYKSCIVDGVPARQDVYDCVDGTKLVVFMDQMYAVTGGKIQAPEDQPFQDSPEYGNVYSACTGK